MKTIDLMRSSTPENPEYGWGDHVAVYDGTTVVHGGHASCCPNPYRVNRNGNPTPWRLCYGWIADGVYGAACMVHHKYGKCLLIEGGRRVPSRTPNPAHGGKMWLSELFVHSGALGSKRQDWRGSRGCPTIPPDEWVAFIDSFDIGEIASLQIRPFVENRCGGKV